MIVQTPDGFLALENGKRPQRLDANGIGFGMLTIPDAESPYGVRILNRASGEFVLPVDLREFHLKINVDMFLDLVHSGVVSDSILLDVQRSGALQQAKGINLYFGFGIGTLEGDGVKLVFNRDYTIWDKENGFWVVAGSEEDGFVMNNNVTLVDPNTHDIISETTLNAILLTDGSILTITNVWGDRMLEDDSAGRRRFNFQVIDKRDSVDSRVSILLQVDNGDCATARPNNSDSSRPFTACKLAGGSISLDRGWEIVPNLVPTSVFTNLSVNNQFILVDFGDLKLRQAFAELQKHVLVSLR